MVKGRASMSVTGNPLLTDGQVPAVGPSGRWVRTAAPIKCGPDSVRGNR